MPFDSLTYRPQPQRPTGDFMFVGSIESIRDAMGPQTEREWFRVMGVSRSVFADACAKLGRANRNLTAARKMPRATSNDRIVADFAMRSALSARSLAFKAINRTRATLLKNTRKWEAAREMEMAA